MPMIGPERHPQIFSSCCFSFLLFFNKCFHYGIHIYIPIKVVCLMEIAFSIAPGATQMDKMNTVAQSFNHARQIIICPYTK